MRSRHASGLSFPNHDRPRRCRPEQRGRRLVVVVLIQQIHTTRSWSPAAVHAKSEEGIALLIVLVAMTVLMALGGGLLMVVTTEVRIAAHYRDGLEAFHA